MEKKRYKIMFGIIKENMFIVLITSTVDDSNHTKCV